MAEESSDINYSKVEWEESGEQVWSVTFYGGLNCAENDADTNDKVRTVIVLCESPEDALRAVRSVHDEFAIIYSLARKFPLQRVISK